MKKQKYTAAFCAAVMLSTALLTGCGGVTEEMKNAREAAIEMMENGDYEGAVREFEALVGNAKKVTDFELDVLKYRAEAEFMLEDYKAAAYTYNILNQVDKERAEYDYFGAIALAKAGDTEGAKERIDAGVSLDEKDRKKVKGSDEDTGRSTGYTEAVKALAEAYASLGVRDEAEELYRDLLKTGYGTSDVFNRLVVSAMESGNYEEALELADNGLELADGIADRELTFNKAVCMEYLGQFREALSMFQGYVEKYGSDERAEHEIAFLRTR